MTLTIALILLKRKADSKEFGELLQHRKC